MNDSKPHTSTLSKVPLLIIIGALLLLTLVCQRLYDAGNQRFESFYSKETSLSYGAVNSVAGEAAIYIDTRWQLVDLLIQSDRDLFESLSLRPDDKALRAEAWKVIQDFFPEATNFTVTSALGEVLIQDFRGRIGEGCENDISYFASTGGRREAFIHNNPDPSNYHFDVLGRIGESEEEGILMVSLGTTVLQRLLGNSERQHHRLYLVRDYELSGHIDLGSTGPVVTLKREAMLSQEEKNNSNAMAVVSGTRWHVIDIPMAGLFVDRRAAIFIPIWWEIGLICLVALSLLATLIVSERRRAQAEQEVLDYQLTLENRVKERTREMELANKAKSDFLSNMSHELRTPMNGVIGVTSILQDSSCAEQEGSLLSVLAESGEQMMQIVESILDVASIESGSVVLDEYPFPLGQFVAQSAREMENKAIKKGLLFSMELENASMGQFIGDASHLAQIINCLGDNAVKFTKQGRVDFVVKRVGDDGQNKSRFRFEIRDTGVGIAPEDHQRIFELFTQVDETSTREYGGTGLGLTSSRHWVIAMGGEIGVDSKIGEGSVFWFEVSFRHVDV